MSDGKRPGRCISRGELGAILLRALRGAGAEEAPGGRGPTGLPEDLFLDTEEDLRAHLEGCSICREELEELAEFIRAYTRKMGSIEGMDERFEAILGGIPLVYQPYYRPFERPHSMAAATEPAEEETLRFCSPDGRYIFRAYPDIQTGGTAYYLIAETGNRTIGVEISINGRTYSTDEEGKIEAGPGEIEITSNSRIFIKRGLRN